MLVPLKGGFWSQATASAHERLLTDDGKVSRTATEFTAAIEAVTA
jgi:hypothetical protein